MRRGQDLPLRWLDSNYMDRNWRRKTLWRKPNYWFRVAVRARDKQNRKAYLQLPTKERPPACLSDCLIKFLKHVGLTRSTAGLKATGGYKPHFGTCITKMRQTKKFRHKNISVKSFNLWNLEEYVLYLFQIQAIHVATKDVDNTHAVCVFNSKIFDANIEDPLDFNIPNLNACCLGGEDWVFNRLSKIAMFKPKKAVRRFIMKKIISS